MTHQCNITVFERKGKEIVGSHRCRNKIKFIVKKKTATMVFCGVHVRTFYGKTWCKVRRIQDKDTLRWNCKNMEKEGEQNGT